MGKMIAVIGAGGKTTAMELLAWQSRDRSVLVTTTTHIYPMEPPRCRVCLRDPSAEGLVGELSKPGIVCAGASAREGKLGILPEAVLKPALEAADLTVCEADGSRHHPLKLHNPREPVLLPGTDICLVVAGLSAIGKPVSEVVHRWELVWPDTPERRVGTEEFLACVLETVEASGLPKEKIRVFLNQADALDDPDVAEKLVARLEAQGLNARFGSLHQAPDLLSF